LPFQLGVQIQLALVLESTPSTCRFLAWYEAIISALGHALSLNVGAAKLSSASEHGEHFHRSSETMKSPVDVTRLLPSLHGVLVDLMAMKLAPFGNSTVSDFRQFLEFGNVCFCPSIQSSPVPKESTVRFRTVGGMHILLGASGDVGDGCWFFDLACDRCNSSVVIFSVMVVREQLVSTGGVAHW